MIKKRYNYIDEIKKRMDPERFDHTNSVVQTALRLSEDKDVDNNKVEIAAMLHDIAKNKSLEEIKMLINSSNWMVDDLEMSISAVLHAPAGAVVAENDFLIQDKDILEAIRFHTLGHPDMGLIALIIFVADFIEPNRVFMGIEKIRQIVYNDFQRGIVEICNNMIEYQITAEKIIHPNTVMLRNKFLLY